MQLDHMVVLVRAMDASLPWYSALLRALGFEKSRDHVWWNGSVAIDLQEARAGTADYERYAPGLNHLGFTAPTIDDFHAVRAAMADAGFDVPEIQRLGDQTATFFKDPDGMRLEITHYG